MLALTHTLARALLQPAGRESAANTLLALMANCGASAVLEAACSGGSGKGLTHKNWRVREGVLTLYAQALTESLAAGSAQAPAAVAVLLACGSELVLPHACALLSDARPELRKAAVDACAAQALREGLARITARA